MLLGILVAAVASLVLATAMHFFATVRNAVYPLLIASQTVPIPILAPVLVLWLGFGILPKLVVVALVSFFSIVVTTLAGFASVDPDLLKLMRTFDATRRRVFWSIELPTALPGCSPAPRSPSSLRSSARCSPSRRGPARASATCSRRRFPIWTQRGRMRPS